MAEPALVEEFLPVEPPDLPAPEEQNSAAPLPLPEVALAVQTIGPQVEINGAPKSKSRPKFAYYVDVRATFDDNIFISAREKESDLYFSVSPGIALGWGDVRGKIRELAIQKFLPLILQEDSYPARSFLVASYSPTGTLFVDHRDESDLDHNARIELSLVRTRLQVGLEATFKTLSGPDTDVGGRVKRTIYSAEMSAQYDYGHRTNLETSFSGTIQDYETDIGSREWVNQSWFNYEYGARTTLGLGFRLGYLDVDFSPGQLYEQLLVRAEYNVTEKIAVEAELGVEYRQIEGTDNPVNPVFGLGLNYKPFDQTQIALNASRATTNSAGSAGQNIVASSVDATVRQRFFKRYYLGVESSYANYAYDETIEGVTAGRTDDTFSVRPFLTMELTKKAGLELSYEYYENASTVERFSFVANRVFLQFNLLF